MIKKAFTLSEVLVTLVVIGVVAALTLPAVVTYYQKITTVNKIKKFYTNMNQVLQMARADYGDFSTWDRSNTETFYKTYINPYLKDANVKYVYPINMGNVFKYGLRFIFSDGTMAIISSAGAEQNSYKSPVIIFYPNFSNSKDFSYSKFIKHPTREQFYFYIDNNGNLVAPDMNKSRANLIQTCSAKMDVGNGKDYGNNGHRTCSTLIYKDGWKIEKDYPW